jgi:hypothetical protein
MTFWAAGTIAVGSLAGSALSADASKSAANTQVKASQQATAQQQQAAQSAIQTQQQVLDAQARNAENVKNAQIQATQDQYNRNMGIAAETRDAQLGVSKDVLGQQQGVFNPYQQAGLAGQNQLMNYLGIGANTGAQGYGQYANAQFTPEAFAANQDPGYGFRMKEGLKAVDAQAAARGGLISGAALKASQRFGQDMASQEYQNAFNRYQTSRQATLAPYQQLQNTGFNAATGLANASGNYGTNALGAYGGYGAAATNASTGLGTGLYNATGNAGSMINSAYGNYGGGVTGALTGFGNNQANLTTGAANAQAAGQVGQANALNQGISGASNAYYQNQLLNTFANKNTNTQLANQYGPNNVYGPGAANYQPAYNPTTLGPNTGSF